MNDGYEVFSKKLITLGKYIKLNALIKKDKFKNEDVKKYYKTTKYLLYRVFGHPLGYMHMAILEIGNDKDCDFYYQPKKIAELIIKHKSSHVLELGSGQSSNIIYLSKRFPNVKFSGIDLYPRIINRNNVSIYEGDYHNLKQIKSESMDIVYAIETLCYSSNKQKVYDEVYRVLKKGGIFVVWDGYLNVPRKNLTQKQLNVVNAIENGFCLNEFEYFGNIKEYEKRFKIIKSRNMKNEVLPFAIQSANRIEQYMKWGIFFKIFCKIFPKRLIHNIAPIYLMADSLKYELFIYYESIYRK
jgi:ubiquinone/menaquinone biosynthesis C-methylase UbiE